MKRMLCVSALLLGAGILAPAAGDLTIDQKEAFLQNARIIGNEAIVQGTTHSMKLKLSDGRVTHAAHAQIVDVFKSEYRSKEGVEKNFKDTYKFNIAAWRVARLIGLTDLTPACVYREVDGKPAAVCWWIDDVMMDELKRREKSVEPPDPEKWTRQLNLIRDFDQLIDNTDRNQGNLLIDKNWDLWMIDHSRAFRTTQQLRKPENLRRCSSSMLEAMKGLTVTVLNRQLRPFLTDEEIQALLVRRDLMVKLFAKEVSTKGADAVFFDMPRRTPLVTIP